MPTTPAFTKLLEGCSLTQRAVLWVQVQERHKRNLLNHTPSLVFKIHSLIQQLDSLTLSRYIV